MLTPEQINNKYPYGTKLVRKKSLSGKEDIAYVVTHSVGYDIVVKMSKELPYIAGQQHFFVHIEKLVKNWLHPKEGVQLKLTI